MHLITKLGIQRLELEEKTRRNNLIQNPSNLCGYSCDICQTLDCNNDETFLRHMKEDCKVKDKAERWKHLICFCRGCQVILFPLLNYLCSSSFFPSSLCLVLFS